MKKVLISFISMILILSMFTCVNAAVVNTGSVSLTSSATTVYVGKELTITVSAKDSEKLNAITFGTVSVTDGTNVVDGISVSALTASDKTSRYSEGTTTGFTCNETATDELVNMCTITISVGENVSAGNYIVEIPDIKVYNYPNDDETNIGKKTIEFTVKKDETTAGGDETTEGQGGQEEADPSNGDDTTKKGTDSEPGNTSSGGNSTSKKTTTTTKLPQTGLSSSILFLLIACCGISIISFISYKKYKNI